MGVYMGEDEVIKKNMALAQEKFYTVEYMEALSEDVRAELIDGRLFYMAAPTTEHQRLLSGSVRGNARCTRRRWPCT